jgi:hypothetical protein
MKPRMKRMVNPRINKGGFSMKSKVVSGMSGFLLAFALILTGCDDGGNGGGGSFSVTGAPVYTATSYDSVSGTYTIGV